MQLIDIRSDTVTQPTAQMREAMFYAQVGDDVFGDDPTVNELEALAAQKVGKEAALFVPTGTQGNSIAVMAHTRRGQSVIMSRNCHIATHEAGGYALLSGVSACFAEEEAGIMHPQSIAELITDTYDPHIA